MHLFWLRQCSVKMLLVDIMFQCFTFFHLMHAAYKKALYTAHSSKLSHTKPFIKKYITSKSTLSIQTRINGFSNRNSEVINRT